MQHKILYRYLPIFLSVLVVLCCVPMRATAASSWNGPVEFAEETVRILMEQSTVTYAPQTNVSNGTGIKNASVTYHGTASNILRIHGLSGSSIIDGTLVLYGSIPYESTTNVSVGPPSLMFTSDTPDGVTFGGYIRSASGTSLDYAIEVQFNEYYSTSKTLNIPFNIDIRQMRIYSNLDPNHIATITSSILLNMEFGGEWAGIIDVYTDLQDNPSMDSYFAEQNQTIIDQSQTQNNLTTEQNTLIQNQTNQQHSDSQAEINQSIQNTDQITNGYSDQSINNADAAFNAGADDLTSIEDDLTDSSSKYVNDFTSTGFDTSLLTSIGPSLNFVVTWFANFWNIGGALTSSFTLSFAIFIAFYILRVRG